jgi:hypothetical protein
MPDPATMALIISGILGGVGGAIGGGGKSGPSKRQIDEQIAVQRQGQNNKVLQQLAQLLLRNSGRGGF